MPVAGVLAANGQVGLVLAILVGAVANLLGSLIGGAGDVRGTNYQRVSGPVEMVAIVVALAVLGAVGLWIHRGRADPEEIGAPDPSR